MLVHADLDRRGPPAHLAETQRERLERYCQAMDDWHVVSAFEDQATGVTLDRPGLQQALELARERRFDLLLVNRVDRLSRKVRQLAGLVESAATRPRWVSL